MRLSSVPALVLEPLERQCSRADGPHQGPAAAAEDRPEVITIRDLLTSDTSGDGWSVSSPRPREAASEALPAHHVQDQLQARPSRPSQLLSEPGVPPDAFLFLFPSCARASPPPVTSHTSSQPGSATGPLHQLSLYLEPFPPSLCTAPSAGLQCRLHRAFLTAGPGLACAHLVTPPSALTTAR